MLLFLTPLQLNLPPLFGFKIFSAWNGFGIILAGVLLLFVLFYGGHLCCSSQLAKFRAWAPLIALLILILYDDSLQTVEGRHQLFVILTVILFIPTLYPMRRFLKRTTLSVLTICTTSLYGIWGLIQFSWQHSLGVRQIGETVSGANIAGIAKFTAGLGLNAPKLIRAYGPFPHANILSGVLILGLILAVYYFINTKRTSFLYLAYILFVAQLVTFSRAGLISLVLLGVLVAWRLVKDRYAVKQIVTPILILVMTILVFTPLLAWRMTDKEDAGVSDRLNSYDRAGSVSGIAFIGIGPGQYSHHLERYLLANRIPYEPWQIEPLHSTPLLALIELGWGPVLAFIVFIAWMMLRLYRRTWYWLIPLAPLLMVDHYFYTQESALLWFIMTAALLAEAPQTTKSMAALPASG